MEILKIPRNQVLDILVHLIGIVVKNETMAKNEAKFLIYLGGKLGIEKQCTQDLLDLTLREIHLHQDQHKLLSGLAKIPPIYTAYTD